MRHSLIVSICTPARASIIMSASSEALKAEMTSPMKSDDPGVSQTFTSLSFQVRWAKAL